MDRYWSRKHGRFVEGPYGDRKKLMRRLCKKAGVRYFRFHPIRHSGASIMDGNGVPLGAIQRILGHENRKTTEIYLHSMGDSERDAMRVFEQARQKSPHFPHTGAWQKKKGLVTVLTNPLNLLNIYWCRGTESNCRHGDFQSPALPTELPRHMTQGHSFKIKLTIPTQNLCQDFFSPYTITE